MNKKIIKAIVLVLVFFAALAGFGLFTNVDNVDMTSKMPEATLPVVCLKKGDTSINRLFGYRGEMDAVSMRDTITPLAEDLVLPVTVQAFRNHVESISYEVRTLDTERLIESTQVSGFVQTDGQIETEFHIENLLEPEQEYMLIITLKCEREEIRYYTRIIRADEWDVDEAISFATDFHEKTFDDKAVSELAKYLEPGSAGDNTTLNKVTIHSSLSQVAWGDFKGQVLEEPIPSVKEIGSLSNTIVLDYVIAATGENGETEFYNVEEYYRVRYSRQNKRMYLLDYERTMDEIFKGSGENITDTALLLGIRDRNVSYMANENATIISFVQEGDLWSYNTTTNQLSLVYSFRGIEGVNVRENNRNHDIRIIRVNEAGSIDFAVYGYMNRGEHEGYTGIGVYHFDSIANTIQEELFVQSNESYQMMKETWGKLFYTSGKGNFYMAADASLYRIQLSDGSAEELKSGLNQENFAVSEDGRYIAWCEEAAENRITVMDLEKESQWQISGENGEFLVPVGFVESDFVYGVGRQADTAPVGELLYKIVIVDKDRQVIKEYEKAGYFITDAYVDNTTVFLDRVWKEGSFVTAVEGDAIKSHEIEAAQNIKVETITTERKQAQVTLAVNHRLPKKAPQVLTPKEVVHEEETRTVLPMQRAPGQYFVYAKGKVLLSTLDAAEAVQCADENSGVVIGDGQKYIWRRGRRAGKVQVEVSVDISGLSGTGKSPQQMLEELMPQAKVQNLTGCTVSQVLYYVDRGTPVLALGKNKKPLFIVGFDDHNTILYDPAAGTRPYKMGLKDSEEFLQAEEVFLPDIWQIEDNKNI